ALLAGLGIDFITVLYGRYVDERNRGATMAEAIITMTRSTLPGVIIAAVTTAATFFAFLATDFRGMTQLGFLTGVGILLFLLAVMFLLPALIVLGERPQKRAPKLYLHSFGSGHLIDRSIQRPGWTIAIWIAFIAVCGLLSFRLRFSDNIQDLRAKGNEGVIVQAEITKKFGQSFDAMMYVVHGRTLDEAMAKTYAAARDLQPLVADHTIGSFNSISTFLPPREQQLAVIEELRRGRADRFNVARIEKTFNAALVENGFRPEPFENSMRLFGQALAPEQPVSLDNINNTDIMKLAARFVKPIHGDSPKGDERWMSVIIAF